MNISDVSERPLVFSPTDKISRVASRMYAKRKHEALIFSGKDLLGMITARDLVKRNINDPDRIELKAIKSLIQPVTPFTEKTELKELVTSILINNYRSVPVTVNGNILILTKLGLLKLIPKAPLKTMKAQDVMFFPSSVTESDSLSVAKSVIRQLHSYRLAILDERDRITGLIDSLDLLKTFVSKGKAKRGELVGDKTRSGAIKAGSRSIIQRDYLRTSPDTPLTQIVEKMIKKGADTVVVEENEKLAGMITPREILKLAGKEISGIYVRISGMQDEDIFIKSVVDEEIRNEIKKLAKFIPIDYMVLDVHRQRSGGKRIKYSVRARLITQKGFFFAKDFAWDLTKATRGVLHKLEREVTKKIGKSRASVDRALVRHR